MEKDIYTFLNSDLTEAEYYHLSKDNLINLKDYLLEMREKDKEFRNIVKEPIEAIKEKCNWLQDIGFDSLQKPETGEYLESSIWLFTVNGHNIIVHKKFENNKYVGLGEKLPVIYLVSGKNREFVKRQKELANIQEELEIIDSVGHSFYDGLLYSKDTISKNFHASYTPGLGMTLWENTNYELIASFYERKIKEYNKAYFNNDNKGKVLTKIQFNR